ncbi:MAG: SMP-30/gluconolactonase/LRE family protein [Rhodobacterales bacterium]|nr:SMP-30/gluconolactonase/LRE family protein [Rhodobacterales bacterium]
MTTTQGAATRAPIAFTILPEAPAALGESPVWDEANGVLWWVDIDGHTVRRTDPDGGATRAWPAPETPGFVVPTRLGLPAVGMETGIFLFDPRTATFERVVRLDQTGVRFNDATVDWTGRLWAGTLSMTPPEPVGVLYAIGADRQPRPVVADLYTPNGLAADPARRRLYLADSHPDRQAVWILDLDATAWPTTAERRPFASMKDLAGRPDGAALDSDGNYWCAAVGGGRAIHVFAPDGALLRTVPVPALHPTKPAFGGPARNRLYLTSKGGPAPDGALAVADLAGVTGAPVVPWDLG